jgi:predicted acyltransferase
VLNHKEFYGSRRAYSTANRNFLFDIWILRLKEIELIFYSLIKKDHSTYSYYFVTSGLAFLLLYAFIILESKEVLKVPINFLANIGKNPMVAYVSGSLLITPILHLSGLNYYFNLLNANAFSGFLKGIIYTGLVALITLFFVKKKYFWKT